MGIAKGIYALGEYDFYTNDYLAFVKSISMFFNINVEVEVFDNNENLSTNWDKNFEYFEFGKNDTYRLTVDYYKIKKNKPTIPENIYCKYTMTIPVDFEDEKELYISFFSNGIFELKFIPLSNVWFFFIEDILGYNNHHFGSFEGVMKEKSKIRNGYIDILKKINCTKVVIWTYAQYETENKISEPNKSLQDIIKYMYDLDNIKLYNFVDVLNRKIEIKSDHYSYLDVALMDNFDDKIDI